MILKGLSGVTYRLLHLNLVDFDAEKLVLEILIKCELVTIFYVFTLEKSQNSTHTLTMTCQEIFFDGETNGNGSNSLNSFSKTMLICKES